MVSRAGAGFGGGKRATSEPRRRPSSGGVDAASLLYGNAFAEAAESSLAQRQEGGRVAGRSSGELAMPREERRLSRMGNMADNLWGSGGLGGYMGGGLDACRKRDGIGGGGGASATASAA